MERIKIVPLSDGLSFGARISGISMESLKDTQVQKQIQAVFEDRGLIIFEKVDATNELQLAVSGLFGGLQDHALKAMPRVDPNAPPGFVNLDYKGNICEIDGRQLYGCVNWHFDACYTAKLNRGGVLRSIEVPPEGGLTGFADGIQLYGAISSETRTKFEKQDVLYHPGLMFMHQRFGKPKGYRVISVPDSVVTMLEQSKSAPRSLHPAIWTRGTGERVLHVSPWQAAGLSRNENDEGDALLEALCREMYAKMTPYWHKWKPTEMVAWDNWRFLHAVSGNDPKYSRRMQRTTIQGDYGFGHFEDGSRGEPKVGPGFDV